MNAHTATRLLTAALLLLVLTGCTVATNAAPTHTAPPPSPTVKETATATATQKPPTPTRTLTVTPTLDLSECTFDAEFVEDVNVFDDTELVPGEIFKKTWLLKNSGDCPWVGVELVFAGHEQLGGTSPQPVSRVAAGEEGKVSVTLIAPLKPGRYTSTWQLQGSDGAPFGARFYARIVVPGASPTPTLTPDGSATPEATIEPLAGSTLLEANPVSDSVPSSIWSGYIHNITPRASEIYAAGQAHGNRADIFSKVGDSITDVWAFLVPIGQGNYQLYDYAYLQPVVDYYSAAYARTGNSFTNSSLAAKPGWTTVDVLLPEHVLDSCPGQTPIACEYEQVRPAVAIIMIGTNDASGAVPLDAYRSNLYQIVQTSIDYGVIPILSTIPWDQWGDEQAYNAIVIEVANGQQIPWMDYYGATWNLPAHGINEDGVHPSVPPFQDVTHFTPENLQYGYTARNLLTLHALDAIWRAVILTETGAGF